MAYNKKTTLENNIEAIRLAFTLEKENRNATDKEREILNRYAGFGGLKCVLNPAATLADRKYWTQSDVPLFPLVSELHNLVRSNSKNEAQYKIYFNSIKSSVLTAFYTPELLVQTVSDALTDAGINATRILEPSAGIGAFVKAFEGKETKITCFEKDFLTGKILKQLYPSHEVKIQRFEEINSHLAGQFDIVTSNIPFGDTLVYDKSYLKKDASEIHLLAARKIHNYFFVKGLDMLQEGGILAYITSQGVADSVQNEPIRRYLMENSRLVSAIRLPNNLFTENAGTEVGSDLIILQKQTGKGIVTENEKLFVQTLTGDIPMNALFADMTRHIYTMRDRGKNLYGKPSWITKHDGGVEGIVTDFKETLKAQLQQSQLDPNFFHGRELKINTAIDLEKTKKDTDKAEIFDIPSAYTELKSRYPNAVVLFRAGDFYETYQTDAETAAHVLDIPLIRSSGSDDDTKIRFSFRALDTHLPKLIRAGIRVAIADQLELPEQDKQLQSEKTENIEQIKQTSIPIQGELSFDEANNETVKIEDVQSISSTTQSPPSGEFRGSEIIPDGVPAMTLYDLFGFEVNPNRPLKNSETAGTVYFDEEHRPSYERHHEDNTNFIQHAFVDDWREELARERAARNSKKTALPEVHPSKNGRPTFHPLSTPPKGRRNVHRTPDATMQSLFAELDEPVIKPRTEKQTASGASSKIVFDATPKPFASPLTEHLRDGSLVRQDARIGYLSGIEAEKPMFHPLDLSIAEIARIKHYIDIRESYHRLYDYEAANKQEETEERQKLNRLYNDFVGRYGNLNSKKNIDIIKMDTSGIEILYLERSREGQFIKADIFDHPVSFNPNELSEVSTPAEALFASLNKFGYVHLSYMASLLEGAEESELKEELRGQIYYNPLSGNYETADKFIAGNVIEKIEHIEV